MEFLAWKGIFSIASARPIKGNALTILIYHRVLPECDELQPDYPSAEQFNQQMYWVSKIFNPMPLSQAVERLKSGTLPKRAISITFDDGYEDNHSIALPILQRYKIPATFFVTLNFLHSVPKWDYLTSSIRYTGVEKIDFEGLSYPLGGIKEKLNFLDVFIPKIKTLPEDEADKLLWGVIGELGRVDPAPNLMMTPSQFLDMSNIDGVQIGAHGVYHHILTKVDEDTAEQEMKQSMIRLTSMLGDKKIAQAFPNGFYPESYNDKHISLAKKIGFLCGVSTNVGVNYQETDDFILRRFTPWRRSRFGFLLQLINNYRFK